LVTVIGGVWPSPSAFVSLTISHAMKTVRALGRVSAVLAGGMAFTAVGAWFALRRGLPQTAGQVRLHALDGSVEIVRDRWGVPHVFAANLHDLYFAQGFCHAQDRLWQMEFNRRLASGRLSEVLGSRALGIDRLMRRIGLHRSAERDVATADADTRALYDAYVAGVNAFLELRRPLPPEFLILRFRPQPWRASDTALMGRLISFGQGLNWDTEIARLRMVEAIGPDLAAQLDPGYPADMPVAVPPGGTAAVPIASSRRAWTRSATMHASPTVQSGSTITNSSPP